MNKQIEKKLRQDGYKYWEVKEKDIKRIYINDSLKFLDINAKDAYDKPIIVNGVDFSNVCLNARRALFNQYKFSSQVKIYYDCINEEFSYTINSNYYEEIAKTIIDKLNKIYCVEENETSEESTEIINDDKIETIITDTSENYNENEIVNLNNQKVKIIKKELLNLSNEETETVFGGCFVDNSDFTRKQAYKYQYIKI